MQFTKMTEWDPRLGGSYRIGTINPTYAQLVAAFGEPSDTLVDGKTQAEWWLEFEDGTVCAIWDYRSCIPVEEVTNWSVIARDCDSIVVDHITRELAYALVRNSDAD